MLVLRCTMLLPLLAPAFSTCIINSLRLQVRMLGPAAALAAAAAAGIGAGLSVAGSRKRPRDPPGTVRVGGSRTTIVTPDTKAPRTVVNPTPSAGSHDPGATYLPPGSYWRIRPGSEDDGNGGDESKASGSSSASSSSSGQVHSDRVFSSAGASFGGEGLSKPVDPCAGPVALIRQYERCTKPLRFTHTGAITLRPYYYTVNGSHQGNIISLSYISAGTDVENRNGRSVNFERLVVRGVVRATNYPEGADGGNQMYFPAASVRIIVIYDRQSNGGTPQHQDIFQHPTYPFTELNMANSDRFLVLCDRSYALKGLWRPDSGALTTCEQDISSLFIDLDLYGLSATYKDGLANPPISGNLFLIARSNTQVTTFPIPIAELCRLPVMEFTATTYFRD